MLVRGRVDTSLPAPDEDIIFIKRKGRAHGKIHTVLDTRPKEY